jgi:hypothetical protein
MDWLCCHDTALAEHTPSPPFPYCCRFLCKYTPLQHFDETYRSYKQTRAMRADRPMMIAQHWFARLSATNQSIQSCTESLPGISYTKNLKEILKTNQIDLLALIHTIIYSFICQRNYV